MTSPQGSVEITLEEWEFEWATHVGTQRHEIRKGSRDAPHYDPNRMEDNLRASVAACCAEIAVAKHHSAYWGGHYWPVNQHKLYKGLADVEPFYEVRRIREPGNPLPIRKRDVDAERINVLAWPDPNTFFQVVYVIGEISAEDGWECGRPAFYDPTGTRLVDQAFLDHYGRIKKAA